MAQVALSGSEGLPSVPSRDILWTQGEMHFRRPRETVLVWTDVSTLIDGVVKGRTTYLLSTGS